MVVGQVRDLDLREAASLWSAGSMAIRAFSNSGSMCSPRACTGMRMYPMSARPSSSTSTWVSHPVRTSDRAAARPQRDPTQQVFLAELT